MVVGLTGASGAMGGEVLCHLLDIQGNIKIRLLLRNAKKRHNRSFFRKLLKKARDRIEIVDGALENTDAVRQFVSGCDYVIHCASIIPPKADADPKRTFSANTAGTRNVVDAIDACGQQKSTKLVYISTVAIYGNRNYRHPWARMGDPVIVSAYDYYGASKAKAERYVLESDIENWVVLRQTGILHKYFMTNNLNDGLMFHTTWNVPIEWVTDKDSGLMIQHLIEKDAGGCLSGFWRNDYNICGGEKCRVTGYDTFKAGFGLMGATPEQFFKPNWNIPRNFHCVWYSDSDVLNKWLDYQTESADDFWNRMKKDCWYFKLGKLVPVPLLRKVVIERLLNHYNAPMRWLRDNNEGRIEAFFISREEYAKIPSDWRDYPLLSKGKTYEGNIDYAKLLRSGNEKRYLLDHGYDETKKDCDLTLADMKQAASFRGGSCDSKKMIKGDLFTPLAWRCRNGHVFSARPFTIIKAGFWCPECCEPDPWTYDREAPHIPFYAQVYYDSHVLEEQNRVYPPDGEKMS